MRGYRNALHDAGYLIQNLVTVATGLGIQTMTRLHVNDVATRNLIGVSADADFPEPRPSTRWSSGPTVRPARWISNPAIGSAVRRDHHSDRSTVSPLWD